MSRVLALDTTSRGVGVAVAEDGNVRGVVWHDPEQGHAESLFGLIEAALAQAGCAWREVDAVAVVHGPGSFTGLRIGLVTAKTLAFAGGLRLLAAGTLPLVAMATGPPSGAGVEVVALLGAGRGAFFAARYHAGDETGLRPLLAPVRLGLEALEAWLAAAGRPAVLHVCAPRLQAAPPGELAALAPIHWVEPRQLVVELAVSASQGWSLAREADPLSLVPLYVAASQAERVHGIDLGQAVHRAVPPQPGGDHGSQAGA